MESTAEFKAYQEFLDFYNDYVSNDYCGDAVPQEQDEWMRAHERVYFCYTKRLKDKIMELCDKYSLSPRDGVFEYDGDIDRLYAVCGVDGFLCDEGFDSDNVGFICYGDGSFTLQGLWSRLYPRRNRHLAGVELRHRAWRARHGRHGRIQQCRAL